VTSAALIERFPGTAYRGSDLLDRLEEAQHALLGELADHAWNPELASAICSTVLGRDDPGVTAALRFAAAEIVPRLLRTTDEMTNVLRALRGRHVPAGPSGAPTRGRLDVLPTGRNFLLGRSPCAPLAALLRDRARARRNAAEPATAPTPAHCPRWSAWSPGRPRRCAPRATTLQRSWRCSGSRPVWHPASRRVTGIELIELAELGRPRIDVTLRISGFFRDAFPHLIDLLDDAVTLVAGLDEPDEQNFVAKHARADAARLAGELDRAEACAARRRGSSAPSPAHTAPA